MTEPLHTNSSLFHNMPADKKAALIKLGQPLEFPARKCLFQKGDAGHSFYIIRKGSVTIAITSGKGEEIILNKLSAGEAFGEIALFDGGTRTADAFVEKGSGLISVRRDVFLKFLSDNPELYSALLELLCARLRWSANLLEDLLFFDCHRRLISKLVTFSAKSRQSTNATIEISQAELAKMLGTSREMVNRNLQLLQEKGLVTLQRKKIHIPDIAPLKKVVVG